MTSYKSIMLILSILLLTVGFSPSSPSLTEQNIALNKANSYFQNKVDPPEIEWMKYIGEDRVQERGYSVNQTTDGGFIITGYSGEDIYSNVDVLLLKTDHKGNVDYHLKYGGEKVDIGHSVKETHDRGYIIVGETNSFGEGKSDVWLIKTDSNGDIQRSKTFGGENNDYGYDIKLSSDGGYILVGGSSSFGTGGSDVYVIKIDESLNEEWTGAFHYNGDDVGLSIYQTDDEGYIIVGYTSPSSPWEDLLLIKIDSDGDEEWFKSFDGGNVDCGCCIQQTIDGGYVITGYTRSFGAGSYDVWLLKTDENGGEQWNKTFGGSNVDEGCSVQQTNDGGFIVCGITWSFGENQDYPNGWLIKTDDLGNEEWNICTGESLIDELYCVEQTFDGGFISSGFSLMGDALYGNVCLVKTKGEYTPPFTPQITGSVTGRIGDEYEYEVTTTDPLEDELYYYVDWGDSQIEEWIGPFSSGEKITLKHIWNIKGEYTIKVKAKNSHGSQSDWGTLKVSMPKNKPYINRPILNFQELHPNLFPILQQLLLKL